MEEAKMDGDWREIELEVKTLVESGMCSVYLKLSSPPPNTVLSSGH